MVYKRNENFFLIKKINKKEKYSVKSLTVKVSLKLVTKRVDG